MSFDVERYRQDFPCLDQEIRGKRLVYLDNGASAQVPQCVIDAWVHFQSRDRANVHRGVHTLSQRATVAYDATRPRVAQFLGTPDEREIVFTSGTTDSLNLVAYGWGTTHLGPGDEVLVSEMEHHSNIVPWQLVCERSGAVVRAIPITDRGEIDMEAFASLLGPKTRVVAVNHVSNALGTINPVAQICRMAAEIGAISVIDGAQATPHMPVNVREIGCDFYAFSGHKVFGPTGVGVLYGRYEVLDAMSPWRGGGDMIENVSFAGTTYTEPPVKFEAGTPNIGDVIALGAALDYLMDIGMHRIAAYEDELCRYAWARLDEIDGLRLIGTSPTRAAVFSFVVEGTHPTDLGTLLDMEGVAVRTGHHCAQPAMERFGLHATARASFAFYNTKAEVDVLVAALRKAIGMLVG